MLEVVAPGVSAAIQDLGRPGLGHLGIPVSGAADRWSAVAAALLLGDEPGSPAIEIGLGGTELLAVETCAVALTGADLGATVDGRPVRTLTVHRLPAGSRLAFSGGPSGARAYVGLAGGVVVPSVLGSAATYLPASLGGLDGRGLRPGDRLEPRRRGDLSAVGQTWPESVAPPPLGSPGPLAVMTGPDIERLPPGTLEALCTIDWSVSSDSDRMGARLTGGPVPHGTEVVSRPMVPGAIQVPPDGRPIALLPDHPTVGGYPVVAVVALVDQPRLGQLRPGDRVTFSSVGVEAARAAWLGQRGAIERARLALREAAMWHDLADEARG